MNAVGFAFRAGGIATSVYGFTALLPNMVEFSLAVFFLWHPLRDARNATKIQHLRLSTVFIFFWTLLPLWDTALSKCRREFPSPWKWLHLKGITLFTKRCERSTAFKACDPDEFLKSSTIAINLKTIISYFNALQISISMTDHHSNEDLFQHTNA